jgi:hypothetical protein
MLLLLLSLLNVIHWWIRGSNANAMAHLKVRKSLQVLLGQWLATHPSMAVNKSAPQPIRGYAITWLMLRNVQPTCQLFGGTPHMSRQALQFIGIGMNVTPENSWDV